MFNKRLKPDNDKSPKNLQSDTNNKKLVPAASNVVIVPAASNVDIDEDKTPDEKLQFNTKKQVPPRDNVTEPEPSNHSVLGSAGALFDADIAEKTVLLDTRELPITAESPSLDNEVPAALPLGQVQVLASSQTIQRTNETNVLRSSLSSFVKPDYVSIFLILSKAICFDVF